MWLELIAVIGGLAALTWSADRFVDGAAATAGHAGLPPLLIGMLVIGFGTSAPEVVVSTIAALQDNPGVALGNAYGSNIANITLILGVTALLHPIVVQSRILRRELPILLAVTAFAWWLLSDGYFSSADGGWQLVLFTALIGWSVWEGLIVRQDTLGDEYAGEIPDLPKRAALLWLVLGLLLLVLSSRIVVWGAVGIAQALGVSDLVIGLTVVAVGTSLPELASCIAAIRKGEHDLALGNVIGSNLFNTLLVAPLAGAIAPHGVDPALLHRDLPLMAAVTVALFLMAFPIGSHAGRINRLEAGLLVSIYLAYVGYLVATIV